MLYPINMKGTYNPLYDAILSQVTEVIIIRFLIAWLITLQCKIPVTAGPINPKLPANLKSARLQM